jgi:hypothetical protein
VSLLPAAPASSGKAEVILSRAQRAHYRLSQAGSGWLAMLAFQPLGK